MNNQTKPSLVKMTPVLVVMAGLTLSACSTISQSPDFAEKALQDTTSVSAWESSTTVQQSTLSDLLSNTELNRLIEEALAANPTLQQTLLSLQILKANHRASRAERRPTIDAGLSGQKTEDTETTYTGSVSISWELDLWNKLGDSANAAGEDIEEQALLYQSAQDSLAAEVMSLWLNIIAQQRAVTIESRREYLLKSNENFILQRYRNGLGTLEDLSSARTSNASAQATLVSEKETLTQLQRDLRRLLGRTDAELIEIPLLYPAIETPLADLPEQTLQRRPDLQAAYHGILAADLRASAAYKSLLPSFSLSAALEDSDTTLQDALLTNPVWSLLSQLTAPLYRAGELRAAAEAADLTVAQRYYAYRETLLTAITEVGNALGNEKALTLQQTHLETALSNSQKTLQQYQRRYRDGLVDILDLLSVQQNTFDLETQLNEVTYQRLSNRITLGLALGLGVNTDTGVNNQ